MNIPQFRFILLNIKIFGKRVTPLRFEGWGAFAPRQTIFAILKYISSSTLITNSINKTNSLKVLDKQVAKRPAWLSKLVTISSASLLVLVLHTRTKASSIKYVQSVIQLNKKHAYLTLTKKCERIILICSIILIAKVAKSNKLAYKCRLLIV